MKIRSFELTRRSLYTKTVSIGYVRISGLVPSHISQQPDHLNQHTWFIYWRTWLVIITIQHTNPLYRAWRHAHEEGMNAAISLHWEQCGWSQTPGKTFVQEQNAEYWRTVRAHLWCQLVCRIRGHRYESEADAENGTEDIWCSRCGHSEHFQF